MQGTIISCLDCGTVASYMVSLPLPSTHCSLFSTSSQSEPDKTKWRNVTLLHRVLVYPLPPTHAVTPLASSPNSSSSLLCTRHSLPASALLPHIRCSALTVFFPLLKPCFSRCHVATSPSSDPHSHATLSVRPHPNVAILCPVFISFPAYFVS